MESKRTMITAAQLRAARGLMDWTRSELAKASGLSAETIKNIEHGVYMPQEATIGAIVTAFAKNDVEFTDNNGVQMAKNVVQTYAGSNGFKHFIDDFYHVVSSGNMEVCINGVNDRYFVEELGDYAEMHFNRMNKVSNLTFRALAREGDDYLPATGYIHYRWLPGVLGETMPFCVYGDKLAVIIFSKDGTKVVVITSKLVAKAYSEQFELLWKNSQEPKISKR